MTEKELHKLIHKFLEGKATSEEIASLEKLEKNAESETADIFKDKEEEKIIKESMFKEIKNTIGNKQRFSWWKYASAAAVFIGVVLSGYLLYQTPVADQTIVIPEDAITLELEDGSIETLKEDGTKRVIDKTGKVLGVQNGARLSYEDAKTTEDLVYNTLTVPYGKRFELKLSDGTQVNLNAGTSLKYPIKFLKGQYRKVFLNGEAFFDVSKDSLHPFMVNADDLNVRVLGTRFNVSSYPEDDRTDVVLVEGSVGMNEQKENFDEGSSTMLEPGFKGTFQKTSGKIEKEPVITDIYTAWMGGELVFRNMTFENILRKLERHYNVSISNTNVDLGNTVFNASYGKVTLKKVLEDLKLTHGIDYSISQNNVTIN